MGSKRSDIKTLTDRQKDILIGTVLGDGHLEKNGSSVRLRLDQSIKQKGYLKWKYDEFSHLATDKPRIIKSFHKTEQKFYERLHFSTFSLPVFNGWKRIFYQDEIKVIPKNIDEILISPLSLAVWFMDDGYKRNDCNGLRINTDQFTEPEQQLLLKALKKSFDISCAVHRKGKYYNLYIPVSSAKTFCQLVRPYVLSSLRYKISLTP